MVADRDQSMLSRAHAAGTSPGVEHRGRALHRRGRVTVRLVEHAGIADHD
jgi:hypothetical protein